MQYFSFCEGCQIESIYFQNNLKNDLIFRGYGFAEKFLAFNWGLSFKYNSHFMFFFGDYSLFKINI